MSDHVLIVYASGLGATAEIAVEIGKTLSTQGLAVDVKPVQENPQPGDYKAVLLGSAVRYGSWLPEAIQYMRANQAALTLLPLALFSVHMTNQGNEPAQQRARRAFSAQARALVCAKDEVFFSGRFDRQGAALCMPGLLARFMPSMDMRDFNKVRAWAERMACLMDQPVQS